jgi:DNA repair exonuclease SbcCD nuclease subunit
MLKLLHLSDLHLGVELVSFGAKAQEHRERILKSFSKAADLAISEGVGAVILTGDTFDTPFPSAALRARFSEVVNKLSSRGIYTVVLPGNHDFLAPGSVWTELTASKLIVLKPQASELVVKAEIPELGVEFLGLPVKSLKAVQPATDKLLGEIEANKDSQLERVVLLHGSLQDGDRAQNHPIPTADLKKLAAAGVRYIALGDWHGHKDVTQLLAVEAGKSICCYAGALELLAVDQDGAGKGILVEIGKNVTCKVKQFSELQVKNLNYQLDQQPAELIMRELTALAATPQAATTILNLSVAGKQKLQAELTSTQLQAQLEELAQGFYLARVKVDTSLVLTATDLASYPKGSVPQAFIEKVTAASKRGELNAQLAQDVLELGLQVLTSNKPRK